MFLRIESIKRLDLTLVDLDDCLEISAILRAVHTEYVIYQVQEPAWMDERRIHLDRRIRDLKADRAAHRAAQILGQLAQLQPIDDKRAALQKELADLEVSTNS